MDPEFVQLYFNRQQVLEEYEFAARNIGLWKSETIIFSRYLNLNLNPSILDLGCGAGRVAIGLYKLGFRHIMGIDYCPGMIAEANHLKQELNIDMPFLVGDATHLGAIPDHHFDCVIFAFNGWMQIPKLERRKLALKEIHRILKPKGLFICTTHDRSFSNQQYAQFWEDEKRRWVAGTQDSVLDMFGDRCYETPNGPCYIHIPVRQDIANLFNEFHFQILFDQMRSQIATESVNVQVFSDDCRFWVVQK